MVQASRELADWKQGVPAESQEEDKVQGPSADVIADILLCLEMPIIAQCITITFAIWDF